jgi:hypothetical protein
MPTHGRAGNMNTIISVGIIIVSVYLLWMLLSLRRWSKYNIYKQEMKYKSNKEDIEKYVNPSEKANDSR